MTGARSRRQRGVMRLAVVAAIAAAVVATACDTGRITSSGEGPTPLTGPNQYYSLGELAYFTDLAAATGWPDSTRRYLDTLVHKWRGDLRVGLTGSATAADTAFLQIVCAQVDSAIGGPVRVTFDTSGRRNVELHVAPPDSINDVLKAQGLYYTIGAAFTDPTLDAAGYVMRAKIVMDGAFFADDRRRVMRHELMHALGFGFHSHRVPGSIMYDQYDPNPKYLDVDFAAMEMLYRDEVTVGMTGAAALHVLGNLRHRR